MKQPSVPATVLGSGIMAVRDTNKGPVLTEFTVYTGR